MATVESIKKEELAKQLQQSGGPQVVNVLDPKYYPMGSIRGSKKIPVADLEIRAAELDITREVVTYCAGYECPASREAAEKLAARGYRVKAYEGGIKEWKEAGLPVE